MIEGQSPYTVCPRCGKVSHDGSEIQHRYCGYCHAFHDDAARIEALDFVRDTLRFYRLIEEREEVEGETIKITLACGHELTVVGFHDTRKYAYCPGCMLNFVRGERPLPASENEE